MPGGGRGEEGEEVCMCGGGFASQGKSISQGSRAWEIGSGNENESCRGLDLGRRQGEDIPWAGRKEPRK